MLKSALARMIVNARRSGSAQTVHEYNITRVAELPISRPQDRQTIATDSRGLTEHLLYSSDDEDIYRKVLATANLKGALTIDHLKLATQHDNKHIRDTAQRILDTKVTALNQEIGELKLQLESVESDQLSNTWLQMASNYWELLTLEMRESVANAELLNKAGTAATQAISASPSNSSAHYILGRVSLTQGNMTAARAAFEKAQSLGMPADRVIPYLAECAFVEQDYSCVEHLLSRLDKTVVACPPLSHVARFWA